VQRTLLCRLGEEGAYFLSGGGAPYDRVDFGNTIRGENATIAMSSTPIKRQNEMATS